MISKDSKAMVTVPIEEWEQLQENFRQFKIVYEDQKRELTALRCYVISRHPKEDSNRLIDDAMREGIRFLAREELKSAKESPSAAALFPSAFTFDWGNLRKRLFPPDGFFLVDLEVEEKVSKVVGETKK